MRSPRLRVSLYLIAATLLIAGGLTISASIYAGSLTSAFPRAAEGSFLAELKATPPLSFLFSAPMSPAISTNKTGYYSGETVVISGSNYAHGSTVSLRVSTATLDASQRYEPFTVTADSAGAFSASWSMGRDSSSNSFTLTADSTPISTFNRIAAVQTDKYDYQPAQTANITGRGFNPGETVTVQVVHSNGRNGGNGHTPFNVVANSAGDINVPWDVDPDDSKDSLFRLTVTGTISGLTATSTFTDTITTVIDDLGADDQPGQKDLSFLTEDTDDIGMGILGIAWGWDDTEFGNLGGNTGDACALFDTDADGFANFAFCVVVDGNPAGLISKRRYSCNDTRADRCSGDSLLPPPTSVATANVGGPGSDPFGPTGRGNSACGDNSNCLTADTVANVSVLLSEIGGPSANLTNVCSYPSEQPNSDPSDCVFKPNNGALRIVKVANPSDTTPFQFTSAQPATNGTSTWTINGSGNSGAISFAPGTTYDLNEAVPAGWKLDSASCAIQTSPVTSTGTPDATPAIGPISRGVQNFEIRSGLETVCTFNDSLNTGTVRLFKQVSGGTPTATFGFATTGLGVSASQTITTQGGANSVVFSNITAGPISINENSMPPGWSPAPFPNNVQCIGGNNTTYVGQLASFNLPPGGDVSCTYLNVFAPPQLTVIKQVINDNGGTAVASNFTMNVTATNPSSASFPGAEAPGTTITLNAGAYSVDETAFPGYTKTLGPDCSGSIADGASKTCTITNNDQAADLIIVKQVINDNGGTASAGSFGGNITGTATFAGGNTWTGTVTPGQTKTMTAAGTYNVVETAAPGYATTHSSDCTGSIALGQTKTCTVTNNDIAPQLIVIKHVINDNGGTAAASNFSLDSGGANDSPDNFPGAEAPGTTISLDAGPFNVSETGPSGYTASYSADCSGSITVGQTKTCTVTNNDQAGTLIVIKHVINDNGGTSTAANFTLDSGGAC